MALKDSATKHCDVDITTTSGKAHVHYVEAGDRSKPTLLLLMGFPSSTTQFRDFIPLLANDFHVLAPDFPGFGLTKVPQGFLFTFDNLASVITAWSKHLRLDDYALYMFDYGAPIGFRLALEEPSKVKALISQNGNCYDVGFGQDFWQPIFEIWNTGNSAAAREKVRDSILTAETTRYQYYMGVPAEDTAYVDPKQPLHDYLQNIAGKKNQEQQLDLFYDYRTNRDSYPAWQNYLEKSQVPLLAVWGRHDPAFVAAGAEAYKTHSRNAEVHLIEAGHFALETARWEIADICREFLQRVWR